MPIVELRLNAKTKSPGDILVTISEKSYDYLMTAEVESIRVSTYLDRDWPRVEAKFDELYINDSAPAFFQVTRVTPGSKTRWTINLPDSMKEGEQLTIQITRKPNPA